MPQKYNQINLKRVRKYLLDFDWYSNFRKFIWLVLSLSCLGSIILWFELNDQFKNPTVQELIWYSSILIVFLLVLNFIFKIWRGIRIQKFRSQPSWVYYSLFGLALAPNFAIVFFLLFTPIPTSILASNFWSAFREYSYSSHIIFNFSLSLFTILVLYFIPSISSKHIKLRFSAGSIGIDHDEFNFKISAKNIAQGLLKVDKYISVVALYGNTGSGKSSFSRMIVESIDPNILLYTYISLTETNEAKDFSGLFAERWLTTLKERYPKIDTTSVLPFMQSILRESGNNFFSSLFSLIPGLDLGLLRTNIKIADTNYIPTKNAKTSEEIAKIFGNIPFLKEQLWIVIIDELERAQFDEIYRLIEIIERFKNEGATGLPIKVMFVLCISESDFRELLNNFKSTNPQAHLIYNFFFGGIKSLSLPPIFLPPISFIDKMNYLKNRLKFFNTGLAPFQKLDTLEGLLTDVFFNTISPPRRDFEENETKNLSNIFGLLSKESPRLITQCIDALSFTFNIFHQKGGELKKPPIRLSDLLMMEYIKIKYPSILLFFTKTIEQVRSSYNGDDRLSNLTTESFMVYLQRSSIKGDRKKLIDWFMEVTGEKLTEPEKNSIEELIAMTSYWYIEYYETERQNVEDKIKYFGTLSDPNKLWDYLHAVDEEFESPYFYYNKIYTGQISGNADLKKLSIQELLGYSRFITDVQRISISAQLEVLYEITRRILSGEITVVPKDIGDTFYDDVAYQFTFRVMRITEYDSEHYPTATEPSIEMEQAFKCLTKVLLSSRVPSGVKFIILNSLANDSRGSGSEIHFRLTRAFSHIQKYYDIEIKQLISKVFNEYEIRYSRDNSSIYSYEENFFYTMYQSWSGDSKSKKEIATIRKIAKRDLVNNLDALRLYWNRYPYKEEWKSYDDLLGNDHFFGSDGNFELYMPLKNLIQITERMNVDEDLKKRAAFWKEASKDQRYKNVSTLKNDLGTLKAILIGKNLLSK